jgi:hypothetical protein
MSWRTFIRSVAPRVSGTLDDHLYTYSCVLGTEYSLTRAEVLAYLLKHNLINGDNMTVTGRTLGENLEEWTHKYGELGPEQDVIRPLDKPLKETGHIR